MTIAGEFVKGLGAGDIVLMEGELGAGKTTFVRGVLAGLGYLEPVRSPTFNLIQEFATHPPVMHSDLYRVKSAEGLGLEEYFDTHICFIEWPDRLKDFLDDNFCWRVKIQFDGDDRIIEIFRPVSSSVVQDGNQ